MLYECETWSYMLREEHRLEVFDNKMLRRIFGTWTEVTEVTGGQTKLHTENIRISTFRQVLFK